MNKTLTTVALLLIFQLGYSQTTNVNLNNQIQLMRKYFLAENYTEFVNFVYPRLIEMIGGKAKLIQATEREMTKMKKDGFSFIDLTLKDPSKFIKYRNEIQCSITQEILMKTPQGKVLADYTLIAISNDNGKTWKFIDTSGKSKETMRKYFPNLSSEIIIKPKTQKIVG